MTPSAPRPTVYIVHSADNYIHVQYDRAMRQSGAGAANVLASYQMDGLPLPAGSTIICGSPTCDVVRIDMPQFLARGSPHLMRVAGVVGANGASLDPDPTVAAFRTDVQSETP